MARIVICGAGAIGANLALALARRGATEVVLTDLGKIAGGSTGKAMGGIRQQFSTAPEVALAKASLAFFEALGAPLFEQVGYLFVATTQAGMADLASRRDLQLELEVPVQQLGPAEVASLVPGIEAADLLGGTFCASDGVADPVAITHEVVRRAVSLGVEVLENTDGTGLPADIRVIAAGPWSAQLAAVYGIKLPIRPLVRQLLLTEPTPHISASLPMVIEAETGFHFRAREGGLCLAMTDPAPRWGFEAEVDESLIPDRLRRLAARLPGAAGVGIARAWAGLYDMTPDAHPIIGQVGPDVFCAAGFSGHGFMQSPAVGEALAEEILEGASGFDLSPFRLSRPETGPDLPELVVL